MRGTSHGMRRVELEPASPEHGAEPPASLAAAAYDSIERLIISGEIPPGSLVSEISLSQMIRVGRTPVREALQRLVRDRLVSVIPRRGAVVSPVDARTQLKSLELRRELESCMASLAAVAASRRQRQALVALAQRMRDAVAASDLAGALKVDREFKLIIIEACANPFLAGAIRPVHAQARRFYFAEAHKPDPQVALGHAAVMEEIARGNARAAEDRTVDFIDAIEQFTTRTLSRHVRTGDGDFPVSSISALTDQERWSISAHAYDAIEQCIVTGQYAPREVLSEARLVGELGIGRTPVREALQRLEANHLITIIPRRGAVVSNLDESELARLIEARRPLERILCGLAAERASAEDRAELSKIAKAWTRAAAAGDSGAIAALDQRMKAVVVRAADNAFLADAIAPIHGLARRIYFQLLKVPDLDVAAAQVDLLEMIVRGHREEAALASGRFVAESARAIRESIELRV